MILAFHTDIKLSDLVHIGGKIQIGVTWACSANIANELGGMEQVQPTVFLTSSHQTWSPAVIPIQLSLVSPTPTRPTLLPVYPLIASLLIAQYMNQLR